MKEKILALDDDPDLLDSFRDAISALTSYDVVGAESLSDLRGQRESVMPCKIAILDINLGRSSESGLDAAQWLRENGFKGRIVFLTGHANSHPLVSRAAAMSERVMQKPISLNDMLDLIEGRD
jgi:DNA-binding NtrC family response regulator